MFQPSPPPNILQAWNITQPVKTTKDAGLINHTYIIGSPPVAVLQWVNPIFDPNIHHDLHAITQHLKIKGMMTPELIPTDTGEHMLRVDKGSWRLWSYISGRTIHHIDNPQIAFEAGSMLAQFHRALSDYNEPRVGEMRDIHNTPLRMANLEQALVEFPNHPLRSKVEPLAESILREWEALDWTDELPKRICHGDPKISNLHFHSTQDKAVCMLDLDTVGPQSIDAELGDAWRSWCNPAGESIPEASIFDIDLFKASLHGYTSGPPLLSSAEKSLLITGIMRICLELSSRFCADALQNGYFAEDRICYPEVGMHNLIRAKSQFNLFSSVQEQRIQLEQLLKQQDF